MEVRPQGKVAPTAHRSAETSIQSASASTQSGAGAKLETVHAVEKVALPPTSKELESALKNINKALQAFNQSIEFSVDPESDRTIVKVVDQRTQEVIRQMPSVESLEIAKALDRVQGLLIRQTA